MGRQGVYARLRRAMGAWYKACVSKKLSWRRAHATSANTQVGARLADMLKMGASRPWPEALAVFTGERDMDAGALLEYFAPHDSWLSEQNKGQACER